MDTAKSILAERLAKGEITEEEYDKLKEIYLLNTPILREK